MWMPASALTSRASTITPDNKSNAVTIATWITLVVLVVAFLARQVIRFAVVRKVAIEDVFALLATIFAIGLSVTSFVLASDGLGAHGVLTVRRANELMKAYYASNFLYIAAIGFAKLSLINFFYGDRTQSRQRRFVLGFGIFVLAWTLISIIAVAFQCGLPRPWEVMTLHCYNSGAFWIVYCIIDMTTDVSIIMLSVNLVAYSKISLSKKVAIVGCFAPRLLVIGASLARLVYLYPITPHDNPAFGLWIPTICAQVQVCLSIATACIPFMRPLFVGKESNAWKNEGLKKPKIMLGDEYSYGCCSYSVLKGHKRGQNSSVDSSAVTVSNNRRTPDVSPRISTPRRLSPLLLPRLPTPLSSASSTHRLSESGLRLQIPPPEIYVRRPTEADISSPQTASSYALSPECVSPQPLLSVSQGPSPTSPRSRGPSLPPPSHQLHPTTSDNRRSVSTSNLGTSPPRFSLFPQTQPPRYSRLTQQHANPALALISERSRPHNRSASQGMSPVGTPETRTPSPNQPLPVSPPTQSTPRFSRVLADDPLRTRGAAITTSMTVPAPMITIPSAISSVHPPSQAHSSIPSYYVTTPPTAHTSDLPPLQTFSSPSTRTPSSQPCTFPPPLTPVTHQSEYVSSPIPTTSMSPQSQRNRRILTPQNSSRTLERSPASPVSPPTPLTFWREDDSTPRRTPQDEARKVEIVRLRDVRSSPRIVVQRF